MMKKTLAPLILALPLLGLAGCAVLAPGTGPAGRTSFAALQRAVAASGDRVAPGLVQLKVERSIAPQATPTMTVLRSVADQASPAACGIVLTTNGHVLVPGVISAEEDLRITAFIGSNEYAARVLKSDATLGMTVLKLITDDVLAPLDLSRAARLAPGEWAVAWRQTDEDSDFQRLSTLMVCQGEKAGRYRRYLVNQLGTAAPGALVVNLRGQVVGWMDRGAVVGFDDIREDVERLLADARGANLQDDERKKSGWFGAVYQSVNKEYARSRGLPGGAIQVLHVIRGGPAEQAGLRAGDLIVEVNGRPQVLTGSRALEFFTKSLNPRIGDRFTLAVLRNGERMSLTGVFGRVPEPPTLRAADLGVSVVGVTDAEVFAYNLPDDQGVLVTEVIRGSPAANSGSLTQTLLLNRDVIVELAGRPTPTIAAFSAVLEDIRHQKPPVVLVKYRRGLLTGFAALNLALGQKENGEKP